MEQKYYIGFFENSMLVAIMDLIDGYPNSNSAFIGFFMMSRTLQGVGIGSRNESGIHMYEYAWMS